MGTTPNPLYAKRDTEALNGVSVWRTNSEVNQHRARGNRLSSGPNETQWVNARTKYNDLKQQGPVDLSSNYLFITPKLGEDGFESLNADGKHTFFRKNVNTIAVRGKVSKAITIKNSLKRPRTWDNHIADTFGWRPQSLFATVEEIETIAKELAEQTPTTQPIPGV